MDALGKKRSYKDYCAIIQRVCIDVDLQRIIILQALSTTFHSRICEVYLHWAYLDQLTSHI